MKGRGSVDLEFALVPKMKGCEGEGKCGLGICAGSKDEGLRTIVDSQSMD